VSVVLFVFCFSFPSSSCSSLSCSFSVFYSFCSYFPSTFPLFLYSCFCRFALLSYFPSSYLLLFPFLRRLLLLVLISYRLFSFSSSSSSPLFLFSSHSSFSFPSFSSFPPPVVFFSFITHRNNANFANDSNGCRDTSIPRGLFLRGRPCNQRCTGEQAAFTRGG
jgi:hypothetical protein